MRILLEKSSQAQTTFEQVLVLSRIILLMFFEVGKFSLLKKIGMDVLVLMFFFFFNLLQMIE